MLRDNNLMDKYPQIVSAMGETVAKGGFGTSVTPVSQFYFQQAFNNVMFGKVGDFTVNMTDAQRYSSSGKTSVDYIFVMVSENNIESILK